MNSTGTALGCDSPGKLFTPFPGCFGIYGLQISRNTVVWIAEKRGATMTEVALTWLLSKVTAPVVGATKLHHIEGAARAVDLTLTPEEIRALEEPYIPHRLVGVMAQNTAVSAGEKHV